jgi:hypothetical protein
MFRPDENIREQACTEAMYEKHRLKDANVILRYLLKDHPKHFEKARNFMEEMKNGRISTLRLLEH